jgi:hypothetical protein
MGRGWEADSEHRRHAHLPASPAGRHRHWCVFSVKVTGGRQL